MTPPKHIPGNPLHSVDTDLACAWCRYNLRGLPKHGRCPECGHEVAATIAFLRLARSSVLNGFTAALWALGFLGGVLWLCLPLGAYLEFTVGGDNVTSCFAGCALAIAGPVVLAIGLLFGRRHTRGNRAGRVVSRLLRAVCSVALGCILYLVARNYDLNQHAPPPGGAILGRCAVTFLIAIVPPALVTHAAAGMKLLRNNELALRGTRCAQLLLFGGICQTVWIVGGYLGIPWNSWRMQALPLVWYALYSGVSGYAVVWFSRAAARLTHQIQHAN